MSKIEIKTQQKRFPTTPTLYGLFFEDINRSGDGGLYPEMLRNRAFDDSLVPPDFTVDGDDIVSENGYHWVFNGGEGSKLWMSNNGTAPTPIPAWYSEGATMVLDDADTLNANRPVSLAVDFGKGSSIYNVGYVGVPASAGEAYNFYMFAKAEKPITLTLSFQANGKTLCARDIFVCGSGFIRYDVTFLPNATTRDAKFVISCADGGRVKFGFMSLVPADTFNGHGLRRDLVEKLRDMHPAFLRFPGGCIVEGASKSTAMFFTATVGPVWERPGRQNLWGYRMTDGLGFHEYLQLCEDLDIEPLYVCNCGMTCQARHCILFEGEELGEMLEEAFAAIEYATGSTNTKWGALRAKMGHPASFKLNLLEIGNENRGPAYNERYEKFRTAIVARYPWLKIISNTHIEKDGLPNDFVDEHYYNKADWFMRNTNLYDSYDRNGPGIFVGEFAIVTGTVTKLFTALAEAMFMIGLERNQDIVKLASYAPLFENVHYCSWFPNLILFDNMRSFAIPSYYSWKLLGADRGDYVVGSTQESGIEYTEFRGAPAILGDYGMKFRGAKWNGESVSPSHEVIGHVKANGDDYETTAVDDSQTNEAIHQYGLDSQPLIVLGDDERACSGEFETEIFAEEGKEIGIGLCSARWPMQNYTGDDTKATDAWTARSVTPLRWTIKDGASSFAERSERGKFQQLAAPVKVNVRYGEYNTFKYVSTGKVVCFYINGERVMNADIPSYPTIQSVALDSDEEIIVKVTNIAAEPDDIEIMLDCEVESAYIANVLTGNPYASNSLDGPENVHDESRALSGAGKRFIYRASAYSLNVLKLRKK